MLVATIGNLTFSPSTEYKAEFVDATGVVKGDDVRIAGVKVGTVKDVQIVDRTRPWSRSPSRTPRTWSKATHASIRYRNLVGQRCIALEDQIGDSSTELDAGETIPVSPDVPCTRPHGALQRVQAALLGAVAR